MKTTPLLGLLALFSCNGAGPCLATCDEEREFWQACMDDDGRLCDGAVAVDCVDDPGPYLACVDSDWSAAGCSGEDLIDNGTVHYCNDPDDVVQSCSDIVSYRFSVMDDDEKTEAREECLASPDTGDPWEAAWADNDCQAVCELLGV